MESMPPLVLSGSSPPSSRRPPSANAGIHWRPKFSVSRRTPRSIRSVSLRPAATGSSRYASFRSAHPNALPNRTATSVLANSLAA